MQKFYENQVYHVFNQGNNRQLVFLEDENYIFFLKKIRKILLPFTDILCYCLMPNHFHMLIVPNNNASKPSKAVIPGIRKKERIPQENLSHAIGLLLSSYTKAINVRYKRSGSLFRARTKVKDGWIDEIITVDGKNKEMFFRADNDYAIQCFHYIHENPVKAHIVKHATDWIYSSARDYAGLRNGTICNQELAHKALGLI